MNAAGTCVGIAAGVASVWLIADARRGSTSVATSRSPAEIVALALGMVPTRTMSLRSSWMPSGHTDRSASFAYRRRPSILIAVLLLILWIIPGVLYLVFAGKDQLLQVDCLASDAGVTTVRVSSSGSIARRRGRAFLNGVDRIQTPTDGTAPAGRLRLQRSRLRQS